MKCHYKSGVNIDWSIEGEDNLDMLAGWCNVFHQSMTTLLWASYDTYNS